jgi:hypothetical protein
MKYLLVGDYHIGVSLNDKFLEYQKNSIQWAQDIASKHNATLVQLGDYVDKRTSIDFKILDFIRDIIMIEDKNLTSMFITGNHDTYYKNNSNISFVNCLDFLYPMSRDIGTFLSDPYEFDNILFVPWINDSNRESCLNAIKNTTCEYCIGHFDIIGFKMSKSFNSPTGFDPKIFKKFKGVFSGHYHLNSHQENIHYVGSVCQLNWTDLNESKYVYLLDSTTGDIEKFENPFQMFHEVHLHCDQSVNIDTESDLFKNKHIKLYLDCERTVHLQKIIDWFIDNNISVDVISKEIQLHNSEMIEEVISDNIDNSILDGMKILLDEMDLKKSDRIKIFNLFKKIQMEASTE